MGIAESWSGLSGRAKLIALTAVVVVVGAIVAVVVVVAGKGGGSEDEDGNGRSDIVLGSLGTHSGTIVMSETGDVSNGYYAQVASLWPLYSAQFDRPLFAPHYLLFEDSELSGSDVRSFWNASTLVATVTQGSTVVTGGTLRSGTRAVMQFSSDTNTGSLDRTQPFDLQIQCTTAGGAVRTGTWTGAKLALFDASAVEASLTGPFTSWSFAAGDPITSVSTDLAFPFAVPPADALASMWRVLFVARSELDGDPDTERYVYAAEGSVPASWYTWESRPALGAGSFAFEPETNTGLTAAEVLTLVRWPTQSGASEPADVPVVIQGILRVECLSLIEWPLIRAVLPTWTGRSLTGLVTLDGSTLSAALHNFPADLLPDFAEITVTITQYAGGQTPLASSSDVDVSGGIENGTVVHTTALEGWAATIQMTMGFKGVSPVVLATFSP